MPKVENEVVINAPVHEIYDYVSKTSNLTQIWPSLLEITHETLLPNGGYSYRWKYKMAGIRFKRNRRMYSNRAECPADIQEYRRF